MVESQDHVRDDEYVLRRIPLALWMNPRKTEPQLSAFLPMQRDTNGLSVDRAALTSIADVAHFRGRDYHVVRMNVGRLRHELNLTIIADPIPADNPDNLPPNPAHSLITTINRPDYEANKERFKALANTIIVNYIEPVLLQPTENEP